VAFAPVPYWPLTLEYIPANPPAVLLDFLLMIDPYTVDNEYVIAICFA
jgi:hypothetical protein